MKQFLAATREPPPNHAKRMECVELAPAVECARRVDSGSKLHALHTLREEGTRSDKSRLANRPKRQS